jgi:hypothetical protein
MSAHPSVPIISHFIFGRFFLAGVGLRPFRNHGLRYEIYDKEFLHICTAHDISFRFSLARLTEWRLQASPQMRKVFTHELGALFCLSFHWQCRDPGIGCAQSRPRSHPRTFDKPEHTPLAGRVTGRSAQRGVIAAHNLRHNIPNCIAWMPAMARVDMPAESEKRRSGDYNVATARPQACDMTV